MPTNLTSTRALVKGFDAAESARSALRPGIEVGLLTGCQDRPYAFGLSMALAARGIRLDVIGSDEVDSPEMHSTAGMRFLNFLGSQRKKLSFANKLSRLLTYYLAIIRYALRRQPKVLHILWNNKFELFDRTVLMLYYKSVGKKITLTVHNVNRARRDLKDSLLNRLTLRIQYRLADHMFVHSEKMKAELIADFGVPAKGVTVIPFGINNAVPHTDLTTREAKRRLGIDDGEKAILFFGRLRPYKGLEHLLAAYQQLTTRDSDYRLIVASEPKKGSEQYRDEILHTIRRIDPTERIICRFQFIPDADTELYFKAADISVLPYKEIFHSGVLFLAHSFGLPVIAADVGPFREEIIEGRTGYLCNPGDPTDLASAIERYFSSELYENLSHRRQDIRDYALAQHSWDVVGEMTGSVYAQLLEAKPS